MLIYAGEWHPTQHSEATTRIDGHKICNIQLSATTAVTTASMHCSHFANQWIPIATTPDLTLLCSLQHWALSTADEREAYALLDGQIPLPQFACKMTIAFLFLLPNCCCSKSFFFCHFVIPCYISSSLIFLLFLPGLGKYLLFKIAG